MKLRLETARLVLTPPTLVDGDRIAELMADREVPWMLGRAPVPYQRHHADDWIAAATKGRQAGAEFAFLLRHPEEGVIGSSGVMKVGAYWEIGYWIGKPYWGQGYASEAAAGVLSWAREDLGARGFLSGHISDNPASGRVLEKLGFERAGELEMYVVGRDAVVPSVRFVLDAPAQAALNDPGFGRS